MKIGLISCASKKVNAPAPAKKLYISDLFKKAQAFAVANYDGYKILSAKHGLVDSDQVLEPHDETLNQKTNEERRIWAQTVANDLSHFPTDTEFYIHAGEHYRKFLIPILEERGYKCFVPLVGKQIGEQLSFYKQAGCGS